jgi:hypothetical protein
LPLFVLFTKAFLIEPKPPLLKTPSCSKIFGFLAGTLLGLVKKTIKTKKANANSLTAGFISAGNAIPLINFKTNPKRVPAKKPKILLQAGVLRSGGLGSIKNAFVNKTKSGKIHVLQRTTDSSYPIKVLYGLSIPQMVGSKKIGEKIEDRAVEILDSRIQHEIDRLLGVK